MLYEGSMLQVYEHKTLSRSLVQAHGLKQSQRNCVQDLKERRAKRFGTKDFESASHRFDQVVYLASDSPCGIDIEVVDPDLNVQKLSQRFFGFEVSDHRSFYEHWVQAETLVKAKGLSLLKVLRQKSFEENVQIEWLSDNVVVGYWIAGEST